MEVRWGLRCAVAVVLLASVLGPSMAGAATAGDLDVEKPGAKDAKLESLLSELAARAEARGNAAAVDYARKHSRIHIQAGKVRVVVEASRSGRGGAAEALAARGAVVEAEYADLVQALVAPGALPALASDPRVRWIREPLEPQALGVPGQGVAASGATAWHTAGATGAGARVAVIDVGFAGYTARQAEGDLPASVTTVNYCSGGFTQENHGTAVAEIVHEMAPNAGLTLICIDSEVTFGQAKDYVKAQGIPIVNTSLGWVVSSRGDGSGGPGTPDAIVTDASQSDVLWVTAAGNEADAHWSGTFSDADNDQLNNFSGADEVNNVTVYPGDFVCAELKWDHWPLSNQDYDLYLASGSTTLAGSENPQTGTQPPTEDACWFNSGGSPVSVGRRHPEILSHSDAAIRPLGRKPHARIPERRRKHQRARLGAGSVRRRRHLLAEPGARTVQLARANDRRADQAGHRRIRGGLRRNVRPLHLMRLVRLSRHVGGDPPCCRGGGAREGSQPRLRRGRD